MLCPSSSHQSLMARFVEAPKPDLRPLADEATQPLADLVVRRRQIIEMIVAERNREKASRSVGSASAPRLVFMFTPARRQSGKEMALARMAAGRSSLSAQPTSPARSSEACRSDPRG